MCFHTKQSKDAQSLQKRFKAKLKEPALETQLTASHFNGFEFPKTPLITNIESDTIQLFEWGLIPSWANTDLNRNLTLNARIETLDDKPSFKHHQTHRCLVLADGFYEWKWLDKSGKYKEKYEIGIAQNDLFAFAGIWSEWIAHDTGERKKTYAIVTTEAKGIMREIHNTKLRMPVILQHEQESLWLSGHDRNYFKDTQVDFRAICLNPNPQQRLF